jgi:hypothetical protein
MDVLVRGHSGAVLGHVPDAGLLRRIRSANNASIDALIIQWTVQP